MKELALLCCLGLAVVACEGGPDRRGPLPQPSPIAPPAPEPSPPPPPPSPPAGTRLIFVDEEVNDIITDGEKRYAVNATAAGTLTVLLSWSNADSGAVTLRLEIDGREVDWNCFGSPWPVESHTPVVAAQQVRISVTRGGSCWDYIGPLAVEPVEFVVQASLK